MKPKLLSRSAQSLFRLQESARRTTPTPRISGLCFLLSVLLCTTIAIKAAPAFVFGTGFSTQIPAVSAETGGNADIPFALRQVLSKSRLIPQNWTTRDGLPVNGLVDVSQDLTGYLWMTSYDGIVRFDGHSFTVFNTTSNPEISTNRYHHIFRDDDDAGTLWFTAEHGGLLRYRDHTFTFFRTESGLPPRLTFRPFRWNGQLLVTSPDGLFVFDEIEQTFNKQELTGDSISGLIFSILLGYNNHIYVQTSEGVYRVNQNLRVDTVLFDGEIRAAARIVSYGNRMIMLANGEFYRLVSGNRAEKLEISGWQNQSIMGFALSERYGFISTDTGTAVFSLDTMRITAFHPSPSAVKPLGGIRELIYTDETNLFLFVSFLGELLLYYNGVFELIRSDTFSTVPVIAGSFTDKQGNLWLASTTDGLILLKSADVYSFCREKGLPANNVIGFFEDSDHNLWINTRGGNLVRTFPDGSLAEVSVSGESTFGREFYAFTQTADGSVYATINRYGIGKRNGSHSFELLDLPGLPPGSELRSMVTGPDGSVWFGSWGGLFKLQNDRLVSFTHQQAFSSLLIQYLVFDESGGLWVATAQKGVFYLKDDELLHYTKADGLGNDSVRGIYPDRYDPGTVWFATEGGGLSRLKNGLISTVTKSQGLHRNLLHNITEDFLGRLWMSTNSGIFYVYKADLNAVLDGRSSWVYSYLFTENEGMGNAEGNGGFQNSYLLRPDGLLLYATQGGVAIFDTERISTTREAVRTVIEELTILSAAGNISHRFPERLYLQSGNNDFTVRFTGISIRNAEQLRFRYKLEGYDREWMVAGMQRQLTYTNLPPRTYTLLITTDEQLETENAVYASLTIIIEPAFYQTEWFRAFLLLLMGGFIYAGYRYRLRYYLRQELNLSRKVELRTLELKAEKEAALEARSLIEQQAGELRKLNAVKDKFFSVIAHDLKGPFSGMSGLIDLLNEEFDEMPDAQRRELIGLLSGAGQNFGKLLDNLLSWARMQIKHSQPEVSKLDITEVISESAGVLELMMDRKQQKLIRRHEQAPLWVMADRNMLDTVIRNLLGNAIKFSYEHSVIIIQTFTEGSFACMRVQDHGAGISEKQLEKLFNLETTFSYKGTSNESGTGLGLILCKEMLEAMGGSIALTSKEGEGTTFTCKIPLAD